MLDSLLVAVQTDDPSIASVLRQRFAGLRRFYAPLGAGPVEASELRSTPNGRALFGQIHFSSDQVDSGSPLRWGEDLPPHLSSDRELLAASDLRLRDLEGCSAAIAVEEDRCRLVCGSGNPTSLYSAGAGGCAAWATQAVAAAWMARGSVELEVAAIPELLALEFVAGDRTLVGGARAVEPGTRVELGGADPVEVAYWPREERWRRLPESDAYRHAETALLETLPRRLAGQRSAFLGLTDGVDSRVVAAAMVELGIEFGALTWGEEGWPDVAGAGEVVAALGVPHRLQRPDYLEPGAVMQDLSRRVRWTEGTAPVAFVSRTWPAEMSAFVTGSGAETGRAFYYRRQVGRRPHATTAAACRDFARRIGDRLAAAPPEVRGALCRRVEDLAAASADLGYDGWRCLDVFYADQRLSRWGRDRKSVV